MTTPPPRRWDIPVTPRRSPARQPQRRQPRPSQPRPARGIHRRDRRPPVTLAPGPTLGPVPPHPPASADAPPRHPHGWRPTVLATTCIAVIAMQVALTGCGSTPTDTRAPAASTAIKIPTPIPAPTTPTANAGSTATASPTPFDVLANMPPAAKEHTAKGAEAFARYFFEVSSKVVEIPTAGQFPRLCTSGADPCQSHENTVAELVSKNLHLSGPVLAVSNVATIPVDPAPENMAYVTVQIIQRSTRKRRADNTDLGVFTDAKEYGIDLKMTWTDAGWRAVQAGNPEKRRYTP